MYRHHVEPRVKLYVPKEESFPIPLRYKDVTGATDSTLDVLQECRIDENWNVDGERELSDVCSGFKQFTILNENLPMGIHGAGTKMQATSKTDRLWPETWSKMSKAGSP